MLPANHAQGGNHDAPRISSLSDLSRLVSSGPFRVRNFRYRWPADLLTSWAFEMEALILGWYILVETGSVVLVIALRWRADVWAAPDLTKVR